MIDEADLVQIVKRRLDGAYLMCHLATRRQSHQEILGSAEIEARRLAELMHESAVGLQDASALFRARARVVIAAAALRENNREISSYRAELEDLERLINLKRIGCGES